MEQPLSRPLFLSIGTGNGVEEAIAKAIVAHRPVLLAMLVTESSEATLDRVEEWLRSGMVKDTPETALADLVRETRARGICIRISDADANDLNVTFAAYKMGMRRLQEVGVDLTTLAVDFTSGTKPMSAALVLAGERYQCALFCYQGARTASERDEEHGRVGPGLGELFSVTGDIMTIDGLFDLVIHYFNRYQFAACRDLLETLEKRVPQHQTRLTELLNLVNAYQCWDNFDHHGALQSFRKFTREFQHSWRIDTATHLQIVESTAKAFETGQSGVACLANTRITLLADLYANAKRRASQGDYAGAIARLYRLTELVGQYYLRKTYGVSSDAIRPAFLIDQGIPLSDYYSGKQRPATFMLSGLRRLYQLLRDLCAIKGDELGVQLGMQLWEGTALNEQIYLRNRSILAHGFTCGSEADYIPFLDEVRRLCLLLDAEFDAHVTQCRFPTLSALALA